MRPLTEEETEQVFKKLSVYIGENVKLLIDRQDGTYCFRLHKDRIYYAREDLVKLAAATSYDNLISFGTCLGKISKTGRKFRLHITAMDYLAPYAKCKAWLKPNAEQQFLYGHHVLKSGLARITEGALQNVGVIVYNQNDLPLGFGVTAKSTMEVRRSDPSTIVVLNQADIGEYIRHEDTLI